MPVGSTDGQSDGNADPRADTFSAGRAAKSLLFNLQPDDPLTILCAIAALAGATLLATAIPARRAASIDPMTVLRDE